MIETVEQIVQAFTLFKFKYSHMLGIGEKTVPAVSPLPIVATVY